MTEPTKRITLQFRQQTEMHAPNHSCSGINQTKFLSGYWWSISVSSLLFSIKKRGKKTTFHTHSIITSLQAYFPNKESKKHCNSTIFHMNWQQKVKKQIWIMKSDSLCKLVGTELQEQSNLRNGANRFLPFETLSDLQCDDKHRTLKIWYIWQKHIMWVEG